MCVIVLIPKGETITKSKLSECWTDNPDGAGFMFARAGKLVVKKGFMKFNDLYSCYRQFSKIYDETFVLHFRIGTHGLKNKANTHPFFINDNLAVAHNGILLNLPGISKIINMITAVEVRSDTAIFVDTVLKKLPPDFYQQQEFKSLLEDYAIQNHSKFVLLDNQGEYVILNEKAGYWENGIWYSSIIFDNEYLDYFRMGNSRGNIVTYDFKDYTRDHVTNSIDTAFKECDICGDLQHKSELHLIQGTKLSLYYCEDCLNQQAIHECYHCG